MDEAKLEELNYKISRINRCKTIVINAQKQFNKADKGISGIKGKISKTCLSCSDAIGYQEEIIDKLKLDSNINEDMHFIKAGIQMGINDLNNYIKNIKKQMK